MIAAIAIKGIGAALLTATLLTSLTAPTPLRAADEPAAGGNAIEGCGDGTSYGDIVAGFESGSLSADLTPEQREEALRTQYQAVNQMRKADGSYLASATGRYQLNVGALESIGWVRPGARVPMGPGEWPADIWTDEARALGVNSRQDYLNNPAAQDTSLQLLTEVKLGAINQSVFSNATTPSGVPINSGSVASAAHMMGEGAFNKWATGNPPFDPSNLDPGIAQAHGMTPDEYNHHLLNRMSAGACTDPSNMPISEVTVFELPPIYLMDWTQATLRAPILPGQISKTGLASK